MTSSRRRMRRWTRKHGLGLVTALLVLVLVGSYAIVVNVARPHVGGDRLRYDTFVSLTESGRIRDARFLDEDKIVVGSYIADRPEGDSNSAAGDTHGHVHPGDPTPASTIVPPGTPPSGAIRAYNAPLVNTTQSDVVTLLVNSRVAITVDQQTKKKLVQTGSFVLPTMVLVVLFGYMVASFRRGTGVFAIRSGARKIAKRDSDVTFADVAGQDAAITELRDVTAFLADPERFAAIGARVPKGILLYGPPGCGKTMLAKALAREAGAEFYSISGSDFVELYVGVGASRVRDLFGEARRNMPAVLFIDELDSVGRKRGTTDGPTAHAEQEQALNQILAEMDGFGPTDGVIVLAATNRPDILDPALLRPGRFDRTVALPLPDEAARLAILTVHAAGKPLREGVDLAVIARAAIGMTGADLAGLVNEAALLSARDGRTTIGQDEMKDALRRILEAPDRQRRLSIQNPSIGRRIVSSHRTTFADVAGQDDAVAELAEIRDFLTHPARYAEMAARVPRGILLSGPPGCGKTLLARALAGEANAAFLSTSGPEFASMFIGEGASRVRSLFAQARALAPSIVFIDEIDAVAAMRGAAVGSHREYDLTLNQFLVELDGFDASTASVVVAATNRVDILDPAFVRAGRFDRVVTVALPDRNGRRAILELHTRSRLLDAGVDLDALAGMARGLAGADLANVVNEAALLTTRFGRETITMGAFEQALNRAVLGVASRRRLMTDEERAMVACHELGHALVGIALPGAHPPHAVSIVPHGESLGQTWSVDREIGVNSRETMLDQLAVALGGRVAEEIVFGDLGSGSGYDLMQANTQARRMVCELGMSEALGAVTFNGAPHSQRAVEMVDIEIRKVLDQATDRARRVLTLNRAGLDAGIRRLLVEERLTAEELRRLMVAGHGHRSRS